MVCQAHTKINIYVAEEQEFYRQIYQVKFETDQLFSFLGASSDEDDYKELNKALAEEKPDVILLGAKTLSLELFRELEKICVEYPNTRPVVLLTAISGEEARALRKIIQKCRNGIGIYLKQSLDNGKQLHEIIQSVARGQVILDPAVASSILMERIEYPFMKQLTDRELEILNLLARGYTNQAIARALCIDIKTVAHHLNNIYSKLKDETDEDKMHPRVSVARLYLETTGELLPLTAKNCVNFSAG